NAMKITNLIICLTYYLLMGCSIIRAQNVSTGKILLVIGADISQSLPNQEQIDTSLIRQACLQIEISGRGGMVTFETIGDPSYRKFLRCEIQPNPPTDRTLPPTRRKQAEKAWIERHKQNLMQIQTFADSCNKRLCSTRQTNTDLNGFFSRAGRMCQEPQFESYEKIVYVNSDGIHDIVKKMNGKIVKEHNLNCSLPTGVSLWVSCWKNQAGNFQFNFESPGGFMAYFQQHLKKSKPNIYGK
ncbi:MAG: hypothetical protein ACOYPR_09820, partial [Saprospiraceae bacterium]